MADCFYCGAFVGEVNGDGGCKGRTIGGRDICEQCLGELKYCLESVTKKSPNEREVSASEENEFEEDEIENTTSDDPFTSSPRV
jgi:hypothetical protein